MTDVLLLNLPIQRFFQKDTIIHNDFNPSLGLIYLATFLELNGRTARIYDLMYEKINKVEFIDKVSEFNPKLIAISAYTENIDMAVSFAKVIKRNFPHIKVAIGGPHVSLSQKEFCENPVVDFIVIGEGEASLLELVEAILSEEKLIKYEQIDGIMYRRNGEVVANQRREFIKELDLLPLPKREFFDIELYKNNMGINISTSRGCPSKCIYCSAGALSGSKYRVRDIENVYLEMVMIEKLMGPKNIFIVDDSFTIIKKRVYRFIEMIRTYKPKFTWNCESLINHMDEELLDLLSKARCTAIQYGIESGNQEVLEKIHKTVNLDHARIIIRKTAEKGIFPCISFIIGHYCDTEATVRDTISFIKEIKGSIDVEVAAGFNTPFPGTRQYEDREELGIKLKTDNFRRFDLLTPVIETENFTIDEQMNWMYEIKDLIYEKGNFFKEYKMRERDK